MIITRSPLRVSLGGGGTDLPSYYREHTGFLVAAAIDKYVYITLHQTFIQELIVKYSKLERVATVEQLEHPIIREAMKALGVGASNLEITSMADIPGGTGLGSSGSFTTGLLKALHALRRNIVHPAELAEQACDIELNKLGEPIGKQDQYMAAFGGLTTLDIAPDGLVVVKRVDLDAEVEAAFIEHTHIHFRADPTDAEIDAYVASGDGSGSELGAVAALAAREQLPQAVRSQLTLGEGSGMAGTVTRDMMLSPQP